MQLTFLLSLFTFLSLALGDYDLWYRTCGNGLAKLEVIAANDRQGPCSNKACSVGGQELGAGDARGGNPVSEFMSASLVSTEVC